MKIMFVSHSSVLEYHQQKLKMMSEKYGVEIHLITPFYWYEGGMRTELFTGNKKIKYHPGKVFMLKNRMFHFYYDVKKFFKEINPDIVHIEEIPFNIVCWQFIRQAKKMQKKVLFFTWENIRRKLNPLYVYFYKYSIKNSDCAIAGNEEGKEILKELGFNKEIYVMPQYGINMEDFKPKENLLPENGKRYKLAFVGRVVPEKGIEILLKAIKDIKNVELVIAGKGSYDYENKIKKQIIENNLGDRVEFKGYISWKEIPDFLNGVHIVVLPSITTEIWKEQFGRILIEAFAAKVAVIGSSSGEIPNVINDAGLIFKEGDSEDLKNKILMLLNDKKLFWENIEKGYKRVKENYTNEILAENIFKIYKKLLAQK